MTGWFGGDLDTTERTPVTGWWAEVSRIIQPSGGLLTLVGGQPTVRIDKVVQPSGGSITLTGGQPAVDVTHHQVIQPTGGVISLVGSHPALGLTVRPAGRTLTLVGGQPVIRLSDHQSVQPGGGSITLTGGQPTVDITHHQLLQPTGAPLTLTGGQPVVTATDHQVIRPSAGSITLTGAAPRAYVETVVKPSGGSITLAGGQPIVDLPVVVRPSGGVISVVGSHPVLGEVVRPAAGAITLTGGQPTVAVTDHKTVQPTGAPITMTGGQPSVNITDHKLIQPSAGAINLAGGQPNVNVTQNQLLTPTGQTITLTGGTPNIDIVAAGITMTGINTSNTTSVTIPVHAIGELIVIVSCNIGNFSTTAPTKPAASGTVPAWVDEVNNAGASNISGIRVSRFVATATNHTSGTWTNATAMVAFVIKGQNTSNTPMFAIKESGGTGTASTAPALAAPPQQNTTGTSMLVEIHAADNANNVTSAPAGYTRRASTGTSNCIVVNTKDDTTSDGSIAQTMSSITAGVRGCQIEILPATFNFVKPTIVGQNVAVATTVAIPTHQVGDLIVISAGRSATALPAKPAASGTVPAWITIDSILSSGVALSQLTAYFVATATNHTSGTWTTSELDVVVIRGQQFAPIGGHSINAPNTANNSSVASAITLGQADDTSLVLLFHYAANSSGTWSAAPAGYTRLQQSAGGGAGQGVVNTKDSTTSAGGVTQSTTGVTSRNSAAQIEIRSH